MKHSWHWMRTLLTLTLVLTLCGLTPAAVPDVGYAESAAEGTTAAAAYGMATADDVIVRKQPTGSASIRDSSAKSLIPSFAATQRGIRSTARIRPPMGAPTSAMCARRSSVR